MMKAARSIPTDPGSWPTAAPPSGPVEVAEMAQNLYHARIAQQEAQWRASPAHAPRRACYFVNKPRTVRIKPEHDSRQDRAEGEL